MPRVYRFHFEGGREPLEFPAEWVVFGPNVAMATVINLPNGDQIWLNGGSWTMVELTDVPEEGEGVTNDESSGTVDHNEGGNGVEPSDVG